MTAKSLIMQDAEKFQVFDWKTVSDGEGGFNTVLVPGAEFTATLSQSDTQAAQIAQAITQVAEYQLFVSRSMLLKSDSIFKRLKDGAMFQIYIDPSKKTPDSSAMDLRMYRVRSWSGSMTDGGAE